MCHCFCLFAFPLLIVKLNIFLNVYLVISIFFIVNCHFFLLGFLPIYEISLSIQGINPIICLFIFTPILLCFMYLLPDRILNFNITKYISLLSQVVLFNVSLRNFSQLRYEILLLLLFLIIFVIDFIALYFIFLSLLDHINEWYLVETLFYLFPYEYPVGLTSVTDYSIFFPILDHTTYVSKFSFYFLYSVLPYFSIPELWL